MKTNTDQKDKKANTPSQEISFKVAEFAHYDKGVVWYGAALLIFSIIIFGSIYTKNIRLGLILLFATVVFYQLALATPQKVKLVISPDGIKFKDNFYSWNIFHSFSVHGDNKHATMKLEKLDQFKSPLIISLPLGKTLTKDNKEDFIDKDVVVVAVRSILPERLKSDQPFGDWFGRLFRF